MACISKALFEEGVKEKEKRSDVDIIFSAQRHHKSGG
jgi:hypothetical protein